MKMVFEIIGWMLGATSRFCATVLGRISFDEKGDVYGYEPFTGTCGIRVTTPQPSRSEGLTQPTLPFRG
jgi:hypothetical protein